MATTVDSATTPLAPSNLAILEITPPLDAMPRKRPRTAKDLLNNAISRGSKQIRAKIANSSPQTALRDSNEIRKAHTATRRIRPATKGLRMIDKTTEDNKKEETTALIDKIIEEEAISSKLREMTITLDLRKISGRNQDKDVETTI